MTEVTMQLAEALTGINTDKKKWDTNRNFVMANAIRDDRMRDPLESQGGTKTVIQQTLQAMEDQETLVVAKLFAIQGANRDAKLTIGSKTKTVPSGSSGAGRSHPSVRSASTSCDPASSRASSS